MSAPVSSLLGWLTVFGGGVWERGHALPKNFFFNFALNMTDFHKICVV